MVVADPVEGLEAGPLADEGIDAISTDGELGADLEALAHELRLDARHGAVGGLQEADALGLGHGLGAGQDGVAGQVLLEDLALDDPAVRVGAHEFDALPARGVERRAFDAAVGPGGVRVHATMGEPFVGDAFGAALRGADVLLAVDAQYAEALLGEVAARDEAAGSQADDEDVHLAVDGAGDGAGLEVPQRFVGDGGGAGAVELWHQATTVMGVLRGACASPYSLPWSSAPTGQNWMQRPQLMQGSLSMVSMSPMSVMVSTGQTPTQPAHEMQRPWSTSTLAMKGPPGGASKAARPEGGAPRGDEALEKRLSCAPQVPRPVPDDPAFDVPAATVIGPASAGKTCLLVTLSQALHRLHDVQARADGGDEAAKEALKRRGLPSGHVRIERRNEGMKQVQLLRESILADGWTGGDGHQVEATSDVAHIEFDLVWKALREQHHPFRILDGPGGSLFPQLGRTQDKESDHYFRHRRELRDAMEQSDALMVCLDGSDAEAAAEIAKGLRNLATELRERRHARSSASWCASPRPTSASSRRAATPVAVRSAATHGNWQPNS